MENKNLNHESKFAVPSGIGELYDMPKMIRRGLIALVVIVLVLLIWIFRPYSSPDLSAVSKHLSELQEPFQSVDTAYYLDGGSVARLLQGPLEEVCQSRVLTTGHIKSPHPIADRT